MKLALLLLSIANLACAAHSIYRGQWYRVPLEIGLCATLFLQFLTWDDEE